MPVAGAACGRALACGLVAVALLVHPGNAPGAPAGAAKAGARSHDRGATGCRKGRAGRPCRQRRRAARRRPAPVPTSAPAAPLPAPPREEALDTAACGHADVPADEANVEAVAAATRCLVDVARRDSNLPVLRDAQELGAAAGGHAQDMVARSYFAHDTPEGVTGFERAAAAGYEATRYSEVIAAGVAPAGTARNVVDAWLASTSHRAVLLSPLYRDAGLAVAAGTPDDAPGGTWVLDLGDR